MLKKIILILISLFFVDFSFAISFPYFDIKLDKPYQKGNVFTVVPKGIDGKIVNMSFFINNEQFPRLSSDEKKYLFQIPSDLQAGDKKLKIELNFADNTKKEYVYDLFIPYFIGIDAINLTGGGTFEVYGSLTGSCNLHLGYLSLGISSKYGKHYFNMPDTVKENIDTAYVVCNDIASNTKHVDIKPSPIILYAISKDKKILSPGDDVIIIGKYFKFKDNDDIKVLLNGKELSYKLIDNNKLKITLPYKNLSNANLQVIRNGFKSNQIKINVLKYPKIYQVNIITKNNKSFFRLFGDFDFKLGGLSVIYAGRTMSVINTGNLNDIDYIDVALPDGKINSNGDISCNYELSPSYFYVNLGTQKSNGFFYEPDNLIKITKIGLPSCSNNYCTLDLFLNKNPGKLNVLLNGSKIEKSTIGSKISLSLGSKFVKKGKIEILNQYCMKTQPYYFDFSDQFIPIIRDVTSNDNFAPSGSFKINGEKITHDGYHTGMKVNLSFSPDVTDKKSIVYDWNTVIGRILPNVKKGEKVKISLSNANGKSNDAYFIIGGKTKYMAYPYIKSISYENGGGIGDKVEIKGINFAYPNCSRNQIYIQDKVVYPDNCDYNKLIFTIPDNVRGDTIKVVVDDNSSNTYKLNSTIGGNKVFKKFDIIPELTTVQVDLSKSSKVSLNLKFHNPYTDIYLNKILFKLKFDKKYLPAGNFILNVNGDNKKYYFNPSSKKIVKTDLINNGKIFKKGDEYFVEFDDIFVPYSSEEIPLQLTFDLFKSNENKDNFSIMIPEQTIYYQNIYNSDNFKHFTLNEKKLATIYIVNKKDICFDSDSAFKNCSLALKGEFISNQIDTEKNTKTNIETQNTSTSTYNSKVNKSTNNNSISRVSKTSKKNTLSKREKIAKKLDVKKMQIINKVIKDYIIKLKKKYWGTKKIYYVLEMYRGYKKMSNNISDDFQVKLNYVDGLIYFAKAYFSYLKNK